MSGQHEARAFELVERAHPRRLARHADEWLRCAEVLDEAATRIEAVTARQHDIGGRTGPSMAVATAMASDALRAKARDLRRGGDALAQIAESTLERQEEKRAIERDHPADGHHVVAREDRSRLVADGQESALRAGIAVMKDIQVGEDPRRAPIRTVGPTPVVPEVTWYPPPQPPEPPLDPEVDPDDPDLDDLDHLGDDVDAPASVQGPVVPQGPPAGVASGPPLTGPAVGSGPAPALGPGALGAAALGGSGGVSGVAGVAPAASAPSGARPIGGGGFGGSGGVLGRGTGTTGGSAGRGVAGAGGTTGAAGGRGAAGAGAGGRGRRRSDEREEGRDRDLHDDGDGWLDDEAGPGVLR